MRGDFSDGQLAPVSAGPWFAYLEDDRVDAASTRMLLGPVDVADAGGYPYVATASFTLPNVPAGYYSIVVCDLGCETVGVGDLIGGNLFVGATPREARLGATLQIFRWIRHGEVRAIGRLERQLRGARADLDDATVGSARATAAASSAGDVARAASASSQRLEEQLLKGQASLGRWRWATLALAIALLTSVGLTARIAHRQRLDIPNTPGELIEVAEPRQRESTHR